MARRERLKPVDGSGSSRDGIYIRVSAVMGREDDRFLSPDLQRKAIDIARQATGYPSQVVKVWEDIDVSGRSMDRPDLNDAIDWAQKGKIDRLWIYDLSRWARCAVDGLRELEAIERIGVKVMSTAENVDLDSPEGYFSAGIFLLAAEMQSRKIGKSWRAAHHALAERGEHHGRPPTGYYRAPDAEGGLTKRGRQRTKGPLLVDPVLGPLVRRVFEQFANDVKSITIIRGFNDASDVVKLDYDRLTRILDNPVYRGFVNLNGEIYQGAHVPLVDEDTWDRVRERRRRDIVTPSRRKAITHQLVGIVRCAACGWALIYRTRSGTNTRNRFECRRHRTLHICPDGVGSPAADELEAAILEEVRTRISRLRTEAGERAAARARQSRATADTEKVQREIIETRAARDRLAKMAARGKVSEDVFERSDADLAEEEQALLAQLGELRRTAEVAAPKIAVDRMVDLLGLWSSMMTEERNRALKAVVKSVVVRRATYRGEPVADRIRVEFH